MDIFCSNSNTVVTSLPLPLAVWAALHRAIGDHTSSVPLSFLQCVKSRLACRWRPTSIPLAIKNTKPTREPPSPSSQSPRTTDDSHNTEQLPTPLSVRMTPAKTATDKTQTYLCSFCLSQPWFDSKTSTKSSKGEQKPSAFLDLSRWLHSEALHDKYCDSAQQMYKMYFHFGIASSG